jgi:hypothetical protein
MDEYKGRSLKAVYTSIKEQNAKIKNARQNFDEFKVYLDENISQPSLPVSYDVSFCTKLIVQKVIRLHFECHCDETVHCPSSCLFSLEAFCTESLDWGKWFKISRLTAKVGKAVIGVVTLTSAYETYSTKDDDDFQTFISEPFLTSAKQDQLIGQLRKAGFSNHFYYDD